MSKKYLIHAKYTSSGVEALLQKGGSVRKAVVSKMIKDAGGNVESFYYTLNPDEVYLIVELPDDITGAALSLHTDASGKVSIDIISLLTPEQIDEAAKKIVHYIAPGQ